MQLITSEGVFDARVRRQINENFLELSQVVRQAWHVDQTKGSPSHDGKTWETPLASVQTAHDLATAGDLIRIGPGSYDEALVIKKNNLIFHGVGARGAVAIAPSATNAVAITVDGTLGSRIQEVGLVNVGGEGNGTGGGLYLKGNLRRIRATACKFEGGAFGAKLESTAAGSVGDIRLEDIELAWATTALHLLASGGGDPVTNVLLRDSLLHNFSADGLLNTVAAVSDLWVYRNLFGEQEAGVQPTRFLKLDVAGASGVIAGNHFATTIWDVAKFVLDAEMLFVGNFAQAEGPATGGGTAGRPD